MAKATGIGGVFFRARDKEALANWYETHLGVSGFWDQEAGPTVFAPFKADTDYFPADRQWMINFRVDDLSGLIAQLTAAGIDVETRPTNGTRRKPVALPASSIPRAIQSNCGSRRPTDKIIIQIPLAERAWLCSIRADFRKGVRAMAKRKIAIIGVGKIAQDQHLPVIDASPDFELAATVSTRGLGHNGMPVFKTPGELYAAMPECRWCRSARRPASAINMSARRSTPART